MIVMAIIAAAAIAVAAIGAAVAEGDYEKARQIREKAVVDYGEEIVPVLDRVTAQELGVSEMQKIRGDDSLRARQVGALDELKNIRETAGMTQADEAALNVAQNRVASQASSGLANSQMRAAQLGQGGNAAFENALAANVYGDSANAMADMGYRAQADSRQRAFEALRAEAGLAGNIREQDFGEASARAKAADALSIFNAQERARAQAANNEMEMDRFRAQMALRTARNNARMGVAQSFEEKGRRTNEAAAGAADSIASFGSYKPAKEKGKA